MGQNFDYSLTAANTGAIAADNVTISDTLPTNVAFVSATAPCTFDSGTSTVTCDEGTLAIGGSVTETVTVTALGPAGTDIVNTATVTPDDATPTDNTSTFTIPGVDVLAAEVAVTPVAAVTPAAPTAAARSPADGNPAPAASSIHDWLACGPARSVLPSIRREHDLGDSH